jgi:hypothetical protein
MVICLQIFTTFLTGGRTTFLSYRMRIVSVIIGRWKYNTAKQSVPNPSPLDFEITVAKLKNYKSPGSKQFPAELIQA